MYAAHRRLLIEEVSSITRINVNILMFGDKKCSLENNKLIFDAVFNYLNNTKRFGWEMNCSSNVTHALYPIYEWPSWWNICI